MIRTLGNYPEVRIKAEEYKVEARENKSNYLVQGTILAAASIFARVIGMIYRIPLTNILGDEGNGYYTTANQIYTILLMVSTFSLPLAVSKLVSERLNQGQYKNAQRVFSCAMKFSVVAGGVISLLTFFLAGVICGDIMKVDHASYALRVLSPAIFIFAIAGVFRGYFQGHESMVPTAVSQVIEQIVNAFVSVIAASVFFEYGVSVADGDASMGPALGAAGGTLGTVVSVSVALVVLFFIYLSYSKRMKRMMKHDETKKRERDSVIYAAIFATILPVVFSTLIYNITPTLDQMVFNSVLAGQGYTKEQYTTIYGIYSGKFYVLMNVPLVLASSLAPSVVPSLSAAIINHDYRDAKIKVRTTMRYTMIITIPCAVGLAALASPIMQLLFRDTHRLPAGIMQAGGLMIVLFAISTLSTAVLQGMSRMSEPVKNSAISLVIHVIVLYLLLKKAGLNIYGVVYANTLFAGVVCLLNSMAIRRHLHYRQEIKKTFLIPLISSAFMGLSAILVYAGVDRLILLVSGRKIADRLTLVASGDSAAFIANAAATVLAIIAAVFVYVFFLVRLHGIREQEIAELPKGELLLRILYKIKFL